MFANVRAAKWREVKQGDSLASRAAAGQPRNRQSGAHNSAARKLSNEDAISVLQKPLHHVRKAEQLSLDPPVTV
jgi:hypothetical protein